MRTKEFSSNNLLTFLHEDEHIFFFWNAAKDRFPRVGEELIPSLEIIQGAANRPVEVLLFSGISKIV